MLLRGSPSFAFREVEQRGSGVGVVVGRGWGRRQRGLGQPVELPEPKNMMNEEGEEKEEKEEKEEEEEEEGAHSAEEEDEGEN